MKTILFHVNSFLAGGIEKVLIELLKSLDPAKYRIRLSIGYNFGDKEVLKPEIPDYVEVHYLLSHPLLVHSQKKKKTASISNAEKFLAELIFPLIRKSAQRKALRKLMNDTDVVIDFDTTLASFHKLFANKRSAAYCHFSFGHNWDGDKHKLDKLALRLSYYDKVVMLCDEMKEDTAKMYPALAPKLVKIYNAMDNTALQVKAREPIDESLTQGRPYIVSVGRLHEYQKDFTTLVLAYIECVRTFHIEEDLIIVGYGSARKGLEQLAADAGMIGRIHFTGFQANPYNWMDKASMFLFSSKYEGLPTVIIEAMLLDKPVVATACPTGVRELLQGGKGGILTPVGDIGAMAKAIPKLLGNPALQAQFSQSRKDFLKQFDPAFMVSRVEELLIN